MKRNFMKIGFVFALALGSTMMLTSCGGSSEAADALEKLKADLEAEPTSEKGNWTDAEKELAMKEVAGVRDQIEGLLGENTDAYIDCYLEKVENAYPNFATANSDQPGCTTLAQECMEDLITDVDMDMEME